MKILSLLLLLNLYSVTQAAPLWIVHTNDLHSHFRGVYNEKLEKLGGYSKLSTIIKSVQAQAKRESIPLLTLDAGDFSEGGLYYLANQGQNSFSILNQFNFDAVVIGNHDYLMGAEKLDEILQKTEMNYPLLGANFEIKYKMPGIDQKMKPYTILNRCLKFEEESTCKNYRIAIIGLTTDEALYKWRIKNYGDIVSPIKKANQVAKMLVEKNKADLIIALTHIGDKEDRELAKKSRYIDLIIGGHSHTYVNPTIKDDGIIINQRGIEVPIAQAGEHGKHAGIIQIDIKDIPREAKKRKRKKSNKTKVEVVKYQLIDIKGNIPKDPKTLAAVEEAEEAIERDYPEINQVIAKTEVPLFSGKEEISKIDKLYVDAMRESVGADIAINSHEFMGPLVPPGDITQGDLFTLYPRMFEFKYNKGWSVVNVKVRGFMVKLVLKLAQRFGLPFIVSGLEYQYKENKDKKLIKTILKDGKKLKAFKLYSIAMPEGLVRGGRAITKIFNLFFKKPQFKENTIWELAEQKIASIGVIEDDSIQEESTYFALQPEESFELEVDR